MPHYTSEPLIDTSTPTGDWRDDLFRDGYVVVKNVLSEEKAEGYMERMFEWLETFPYGFDKSDKSTWTKECLPEHMKGGMYHGYRVQHEKVIWDARWYVSPPPLPSFPPPLTSSPLISLLTGTQVNNPSSTHSQKSGARTNSSSPLTA